jgi:hypothetical protein
VRLEISAVDREDLHVSAWKNRGWIEVRISNAVGVPVPLTLGPTESLLLVIVPQVREPGELEDARRAKMLAEANSQLRARMGERE